MGMTKGRMIPISERNRQILQLRKAGSSQADLARRFKLSRGRIHQLAKQDAADKSLAESRARLREEIRAVDDLERMWPVEGLINAVELLVVTRKRLLDHFVKAGKRQISLRELMDMCLDAPVEGLDFMMSPLLRVYGVGKKGFWSVVNGLTEMDLGIRCKEEWRKRLVTVKQKHKPTRAA